MKLDDLTQQRVVLLGMGTDMQAALGAIMAAHPAEIYLVDEAASQGSEMGSRASAHSGLQSELHGGSTVHPTAEQLPLISIDEAVETAQVFVRSPGFPKYLPQLVSAMERGALMTTPLDLWVGSLDPSQRVVAVTGTKGKTTTTDLIGHFSTEAGLRVGLAGNIGIPVFSSAWDSAAPILVLEISSYQAADLQHVPSIAVLTSLTEDHLDFHGGVERYHADKLRVLSNNGSAAKVIIVSADSPKALAAAAPFDPVVVVPPHSAAALPQQRVQNAALAAEVVFQLGGGRMTEQQILAGAARSMPGRLDECPGPSADSSAAAIKFVDDALASNPSATAAGLAWARQLGVPTVLILGGTERGVAASPLAEEAAQWAPGQLLTVTVPENGASLADRSGLEVTASATSVEEAVQIGVVALLAQDSAGGILLFSPAAPTPRDAGNWQDRSASFRKAVLELS
ncbi:UDP-N-acetylmuramoylalanine--D-glutamate ligase [Actinobacteria bacterium IMCC26207]|nr:UDP-N-acetylmuramoylalanine--D-glutamate ligase [Actinobacteria bacterium IMCC26207]